MCRLPRRVSATLPSLDRERGEEEESKREREEEREEEEERATGNHALRPSTPWLLSPPAVAGEDMRDGILDCCCYC